MLNEITQKKERACLIDWACSVPLRFAGPVASSFPAQHSVIGKPTVAINIAHLKHDGNDVDRLRYRIRV